MLYNRYAAPFLFFVTDIPDDFREWLVRRAILPVGSHLGLLFVENGEPVPHDYIATLTNYNMRVDSEILKADAKLKVQRSVTDLLFDQPSNTLHRIAAFIRQNRDNIDGTLSDEEAIASIRNSVSVDVLEVIVPGTRAMTPVYNIYIRPPTANEERLDRWRKWIGVQKFHANNNGVGVKYQFPFKCNHCKSIDHPSGLCPHKRAQRGNTGRGTDNPSQDDEILPLDPQPGPSQPTPPQGPDQGRKTSEKGKGRMDNPSGGGRKAAGPSRTTTKRANEAKKRKVN